jgi:uncharacterized protein YdaU (DUF1376 family)
MNFYPFHIGDYAAHTRHLSLIEDIAYRRLIDAYYLHESPIVGEFEAIARMIGMREYIDEVTYILNTFFEFDRYGWSNKRCDDEIAKYKAKAESARNANRIKLEKKSVLKPVLKSEADQTLTNNQEPITKNHIKTITPEGVSDSIFKDYMDVRKAKKAKWTETALKGLIRESEKAKITLQEAMQICCERGWVGFKAEWIQQEAKRAKELPLGTNEQIEQAYRQECGKDPALARFNSYFDMKNYIIKFREEKARA